jgi:4-carboxymuconolactone decarboxylase
LRNGCTPEEIRDALVQVAIYAGIPAGVEAFRIARKVLVEAGVLNSASATRPVNDEGLSADTKVTKPE